MLELAYQWMKTILIFIIGITILFQLLGKSSYRKYAGFVGGMILMLLVIQPLFKLTNSENGFWYLFDSYDYLLEAEDKSRELTQAQEFRTSIVFSEYQDVLTKQTEQLLNQKGLTILSISAEFCEDIKSAEYGAIKELSIVAGYQKEENPKDLEIEKVLVEKIVVEIGEEDKKTKKEKEENASPLVLSAKNLLADFYNLDISHINITIREESNG